MVRKLVALSLMLCLAVGTAFADEIKAVFESYDKEKHTITVSVVDEDGKTSKSPKTFKVGKDVKIKGRKGAETSVEEWASGKFVKAGATKLLLTVEKDEVTDLKVERGGKKGGKKDPN